MVVVCDPRVVAGVARVFRQRAVLVVRRGQVARLFCCATTCMLVCFGTVRIACDRDDDENRENDDGARERRGHGPRLARPGETPPRC